MREAAFVVSLIVAWALMTVAVFRSEFVANFGDGWREARVFVLAVDVAVAAFFVTILLTRVS